MKSVAILIGTLVILYSVITLGLFLFQKNLIFLPSSAILQTPETSGIPFEDVFIPSTDGNKIHGWWAQHENTTENVTILIAHGNAGNISGRVFLMDIFYSAGYNVFLFDYQGYGLSEGRPGEQEVFEDGLAAWDFLVHEKGLSENRIIPLGRSMGGAVALKIAEQRNPAGLILLSTFTSVPDVAARVYPIFPVRRLARIQMDNKTRIADFTNPAFLAHSPNDELIPYEMMHCLADIAGGETTLYDLSGGHNDTLSLTNPSFISAVNAFIEKVIE